MDITQVDTKKIIDLAEYQIKSTLISIIDAFKYNIAGFLKFLFERNIVQIGIGIVIASNVTRLTNLIVELIFNPIIQRITFGSIKNIENWTITYFDITIKIGVVLSNIINFIFIVLLIYFVWKLSQSTDFNFVTRLLEDTKQTIEKSKVKTNVFVSVSSPPVNTAPAPS